MERYFIHRILPRRKADRVQFSIQLPQDIKRIVNITVICSSGPLATQFVRNLSDQFRTAGHLSLKWNCPGDIFFQVPVDFPYQFESDYALTGIENPFRTFFRSEDFEVQGRQITGFPTDIPEHRTLKGFYKDALNEIAQVDESYAVDLIFTYETDPL